MTKSLLLGGALCLLCAAPASAQNRAPQNNQFNGQGQGQSNGAVFPLPPSVTNVVSIDAQNILIIESHTNGRTQYTPMIVKHVYSGGIARLFGGSVVPTAQFASPGLLGIGQNNPVSGSSGVNGSGVSSFGGNTGIGGNGGNFGGGFINNAITRGTFNGAGAFGGGLFNGGLATANGAVNLQVTPR